MKTNELFEAKVVPPWVKAEDAAFKALVKKYHLIARQQPRLVNGRWVFGGQLIDDTKKDISIKLEPRVAGLQKAIAQHLFDLHKQGREVVTYNVSYYRMYGSKQNWTGGHNYVKDVNPRYLYKDDNLNHVLDLVKDKLYVNNISGGGYTITFMYGVEDKDPTPPKPAEPEKKVYRVVKGKQVKIAELTEQLQRRKSPEELARQQKRLEIQK